MKKIKLLRFYTLFYFLLFSSLTSCFKGGDTKKCPFPFDHYFYTSSFVKNISSANLGYDDITYYLDSMKKQSFVIDKRTEGKNSMQIADIKNVYGSVEVANAYTPKYAFTVAEEDKCFTSTPASQVVLDTVEYIRVTCSKNYTASFPKNKFMDSIIEVRIKTLDPAVIRYYSFINTTYTLSDFNKRRTALLCLPNSSPFYSDGAYVRFSMHLLIPPDRTDTFQFTFYWKFLHKKEFSVKTPKLIL